MAYVLINNHEYKNQLAEVKENRGDGGLLVSVNGKDVLVSRNSVKYMPDNFKPITGGIVGTLPGEKIIPLNQSSFVTNAMNKTLKAVADTLEKSVSNMTKAFQISKPEAIELVKTAAMAGVDKSDNIVGNNVGIVSGVTFDGKKLAELMIAPIPSGQIHAATIRDGQLSSWFAEEDSIAAAARKYAEEMEKENWGEIKPKLLEKINHLEATNKSLRIRSEKKGKANERLSNHVDMLERSLKESDKTADCLIKDNKGLKEKLFNTEKELDQAKDAVLDLQHDLKYMKGQAETFKKANEIHKREVEKGNEYREGLKETIESLHIQLRDRETAHMAAQQGEAEAKREIKRLNHIIDYITNRPSF